jgi:hypothetical protein
MAHPSPRHEPVCRPETRGHHEERLLQKTFGVSGCQSSTDRQLAQIIVSIHAGKFQRARKYELPHKLKLRRQRNLFRLRRLGESVVYEEEVVGFPERGEDIARLDVTMD